MTEYLTPAELHQLTGYARTGQQADWLQNNSIPHKRNGARIIVSRVHVRGWLEGRRTITSTGPNWAKVA